MGKVDDYRKDNRTDDQFAKDIELATDIERQIIDLYVEYYKRVNGKSIIVKDNGCDNSGILLTKEQVSTEADYKLNGKPVEVKFNNRYLIEFNLKVDQLRSYIKQGASILWVNGWTTKKPVFTIMNVRELKRIKREKKKFRFATWGGKICVQLDENDYDWTELKQV